MTTLTPEQLDMIKRLQPFFKERMGEWREGDEYCFWNKFQNKYLYRRVPPNIRQHNMSDAEFSTQVLRIPKPIDWQNPERGLWGMIDSKKDMSEQKFVRNENNKVHLLVFKNGTALEFFTPDPFTALLKALCEQEEV